MGYEVLLVVSYTVISLVVGLAWVAGYLDPYQAKLQEIVLDLMGENKASYGLKSSLKAKKLGNDPKLNEFQDKLGDSAGGLVGKGGAGEIVGGGLNKAL